ncbi:hypothetical protein IW152_006025 [Coemansia sp. BCRC 34962]|nr:hypothetical protein IW152_006025 [Coemansia sp. BCRC 34962]
MSESPGTDNPGTQPAWQGTTPGLSFATAVQNGRVQAGGTGHEAGQLAALRPMVKISTFNTLTGGKINVNEKPSQIVNEILFTRYHAFDIPAGVSLLEWTNACTSVPTKELKQTVISPRTNTGILAVSTDEDLEALEAATICVRGNPVQCKHLFAFKDTLVYIYISSLDAAPIVSLTKDINDALSPYGKVLDIKFKVLDLCSVGKARVLIDVSATSIPG